MLFKKRKNPGFDLGINAVKGGERIAILADGQVRPNQRRQDRVVVQYVMGPLGRLAKSAAQFGSGSRRFRSGMGFPGTHFIASSRTQPVGATDDRLKVGPDGTALQVFGDTQALHLT